MMRRGPLVPPVLAHRCHLLSRIVVFGCLESALEPNRRSSKLPQISETSSMGSPCEHRWLAVFDRSHFFSMPSIVNSFFGGDNHQSG